MHFLQAINSDLSVLIVCNKTGGTIEGDIKKKLTAVNKVDSKIVPLQYGTFYNSRYFLTRDIHIIIWKLTATLIQLNNTLIRV